MAIVGVITPATLTADQNNYAPTDLHGSIAVRLQSDAQRSITGLLAPPADSDGDKAMAEMMLWNVGATNAIVLKNADAGSAEANRFEFSSDITLGPKKGLLIGYDPVSQRWRQLSPIVTSGGGGSGAPTDAEYVVLAPSDGLDAEAVLGSAVIMKGTLASRPAASRGGRLYYVTDSGSERWTRDTGSAWEDVGPDWDYVTGKPSTFPPDTHTHPQSDVTNLTTDLAARVQIGGQLGNTATSPDVRGVRETGGPTNLTMGAVADGALLKRSGTNVVGQAQGTGNGLDADTVDGQHATAFAAASHTHPESDVTGLVADLTALAAPEYLTGAASGTLSAERVVTDTPTVAWDLATAGQAKANVPDDAVTLAKLANIATGSVIGRSTAATGDPEVLTVQSPLTASGGNLDFDETAALGNNARVTVRKNSGADVGTRRRINIIEGTNITVTVADDAGGEEIDITINATGGGGATGTVEVDFGAFPGKSDASVDVTGQGSIVAGSIVQAWLRPVATADHTADEHMVETLGVFAGNIVAGTGFTIYAFNTSQLNEPLLENMGIKKAAATEAVTQIPVTPKAGGIGTRIYGRWTVAWRWS